MFDTADKLTSDLLHAQRAEISSTGADQGHIRGTRRGGGHSDSATDSHRETQEHALESLLPAIVERIEELLPWASRATGRPVGMWVENAGLVKSDFEPFPVGTPYVNVCASSWEAAEAIRESLAEVGRIDEAHWLAGWRHREPNVKVIRIYPSPSTLGIG